MLSRCACGGSGAVLRDGVLDACGDCAAHAEAAWRAAKHAFNPNEEPDMSWIEAQPVAARLDSTAGTLTLQARTFRAGTELRLVAYPAVLRDLPWFRGGCGVSVVMGQREDAGMMRIVREGPHLLLAQGNTLEKLPPVVLRLAALSWMDREPHPVTEVTYSTKAVWLELRLPAWACPPGMQPLPYGGALPAPLVRRVFNEELLPGGAS